MSQRLASTDSRWKIAVIKVEWKAVVQRFFIGVKIMRDTLQRQDTITDKDMPNILAAMERPSDVEIRWAGDVIAHFELAAQEMGCEVCCIDSRLIFDQLRGKEHLNPHVTATLGLISEDGKVSPVAFDVGTMLVQKEFNGMSVSEYDEQTDFRYMLAWRSVPPAFE